MIYYKKNDIFTWKNDILSIKLILNTLNCHIYINIINFTFQLHNKYSIVFFQVVAHFIIQKNYLDYVITTLGHPTAIQAWEM